MRDQDNKPDSFITSDLVSEDESFADIVEDFVSDLGQRITEMANALGNSDFQSLKYLAHQLKGSGGGYGYPCLSEVADEIEQQALCEELPACQQSMNQLKAMVSRVVVKLD
ncbi:MAG: Hpt domain-containing protein [Phycisphaerae bacterium]|nr:Hpt domain-containing protein [Phycisphaerae bacterium]